MKSSFLLILFIVPAVLADLRVGFYKPTCPDAESIIFQAVQKRFNTDKSVTAALLRMHFHDCFVRVRFSSLKLLRFIEQQINI